MPILYYLYQLNLFQLIKLSSYKKGIFLYAKALLVYQGLRRYLKKEFLKDLQFPKELQKDYFYQSTYYNRTKQYMHANHFFGELLCLIRGKKMNQVERMRFANLSSCAPIFDDFFEEGADLEHIQYLLAQPDLKNAQSEQEKLAVHFLNNILVSLKEPKEFLKAAEHLFMAQKLSKQQKSRQLTSEYLLRISEQKGGFSGLMYTYLLEGKKSPKFTELGYSLGSFGQIMDDIYDLYDDAKEGIQTFANQSKKVGDLRFIVEEQEQNLRLLAEEVALNQKTYQSFQDVLKIFISIVDLALEQYEKIESDWQIPPHRCLEMERHYWIKDMEKTSNISKLFFKSLQNF